MSGNGLEMNEQSTSSSSVFTAGELTIITRFLIHLRINLNSHFENSVKQISMCSLFVKRSWNDFRRAEYRELA